MAEQPESFDLNRMSVSEIMTALVGKKIAVEGSNGPGQNYIHLSGSAKVTGVVMPDPDNEYARCRFNLSDGKSIVIWRYERVIIVD